MDVQKKKVLKSVIIIWIVSLVACCASYILAWKGIVISHTSGTQVIPTWAIAAPLCFFLVPLIDGVLLGITLAKQPQRKRKIVLFNILFAVSFSICHMITLGVAEVITEGGSFLVVFENGFATTFGYVAAVYAVEGILFGLLSALITKKVCQK